MTDTAPYLSLCAADGWWSCCRNQEAFAFQRVVVFATRPLPGETGATEIVGLTQWHLNDGRNRSIRDEPDFLGYVHDRDFEVVGIKLKDSIEKRMAALAPDPAPEPESGEAE